MTDRREDTQRQDDLKMEAETGVRQPQAQECRKRQGMDSAWAPRGAREIADFWPSELQENKVLLF